MMSPPAVVDFHCHLDLYPDFETAIAKAEAARYLHADSHHHAEGLAAQSRTDARYALCAGGARTSSAARGGTGGELALWEHHLPEARYVGEVGLDAGPRFYKSLDVQKQVFRTILERCADAGGKILTIHSVRSVPMVLDMIERHLPRNRGVAVLHWFTGTKAEARRAVALGCYFSINAEMMHSGRGRALVAELPMDRLLTETDGPFTQVDGRSTEPTDAPKTIDVIARVRNLAADAIDKAVRANLQTLLK